MQIDRNRSDLSSVDLFDLVFETVAQLKCILSKKSHWPKRRHVTNSQVLPLPLIRFGSIRFAQGNRGTMCTSTRQGETLIQFTF